MSYNQIIENEVFIRGMLVNRYKHDDKTTAVICAKNDEHQNYQYVTFFDEQKEIVDGLKICDKVVVTAKAWIYRDKETKSINSDNMRLRGISIEPMIEFTKRVFASVGVPIYGIKMLDCVRFNFSGSISSIIETKNHKVSILLAVSEADKKGFNLIPLMYVGRGDEEDIRRVLQKYRKGQVISVKGFISQKAIENQENDGFPYKYKNTYYITSFLTSDMQADFDNAE